MTQTSGGLGDAGTVSNAASPLPSLNLAQLPQA